MTYKVNGVQYVAVLAGWGGVFPLVAGELAEKSGKQRNISRLLVYKLGGTAELPALQANEITLNPPLRLPMRLLWPRGMRCSPISAPTATVRARMAVGSFLIFGPARCFAATRGLMWSWAVS